MEETIHTKIRERKKIAMFPLTHLYTAKQVLGYENDQTVLGALFPDFSAFLHIGRNVCHEMGLDMYRFAAENDPDHIDFTLGALTHGTALPGIDYYADEEYRGQRPGFCFRQGELIAEELRIACNLPSNMAVWKAHNIIELAFDVITEKRCPGIGKTALSAMPVTPDNDCAVFLESYLNHSRRDIMTMFREVSNHFSFDGGNIGEIADKFLASLVRRHNIRGGSRLDLIRIIGKSVAVIEPRYDGFMAETIALVKADLQKLTGEAHL